MSYRPIIPPQIRKQMIDCINIIYSVYLPMINVSLKEELQATIATSNSAPLVKEDNGVEESDNNITTTSLLNNYALC